MQRFATTAILAVLAFFVLVLPAVDARAIDLRRFETNAERFRRGEGPLPPLRREPSRVEGASVGTRFDLDDWIHRPSLAAKRHQPSGYYPPTRYVAKGPVQVRGKDEKVIGYINDYL